MEPELFKALSDPTRVKLLACLSRCGRSCTVSRIARWASVDLSVVSRHLALLSRAGLIAAHRRGRNVRYRVQYESIARSLRALADEIETCCPAGECRRPQKPC